MIPKKREFEDKNVIVNPWEIFISSMLAERFKMSEFTIRNFTGKGQVYFTNKFLSEGVA